MWQWHSSQHKTIFSNLAQKLVSKSWRHQLPAIVVDLPMLQVNVISISLLDTTYQKKKKKHRLSEWHKDSKGDLRKFTTKVTGSLYHNLFQGHERFQLTQLLNPHCRKKITSSSTTRDRHNAQTTRTKSRPAKITSLWINHATKAKYIGKNTSIHKSGEGIGDTDTIQRLLTRLHIEPRSRGPSASRRRIKMKTLRPPLPRFSSGTKGLREERERVFVPRCGLDWEGRKNGCGPLFW